MMTSNKYQEKTNRLERQSADAMRTALHPYWADVYKDVQQDGNLSGKLQDALHEMNPDLRQLAIDLLPNVSIPVTEKVPKEIVKLLEAKDPFGIFCQIGDSLAANESFQPVLDKFNGWLLDWGIQYVKRKSAYEWTVDDENKIWRMVRWALPRQNADQKKWREFEAEFRERSWRRAAKKPMEQTPRPPSRVLVSDILAALPLGANELLHIENEEMPSLKGTETKLDAFKLAEYMAQYSPSAWQKTLDASSTGSQRSPALMRGLGIVMVIILLSLSVFLLDRFGVIQLSDDDVPVADTTETPIAGDGVLENITPTSPVTATKEVSQLTLVENTNIPAWGCAAGQESWHKITVTGEPNTTYSIQASDGSLLEGVIVWQAADNLPPDPNTMCQPSDTELPAPLSVSLDAEGNAYLIISQSVGPETPLYLQLAGNGMLSDSLVLHSWAGDVHSQLSPVSELPAEGQSLMLTEPTPLIWNLEVDVPGEYQIVCVNNAMPDNPPRISESLVFVSPNDSRQAECVVDSGGDWQVSVFSVPYSPDDPRHIGESQEFSIIEAHYAVDAQLIIPIPFGLEWGDEEAVVIQGQDTITTSDDSTYTYPIDVGFVMVYEVANAGSISDTIGINVTNTTNLEEGEGIWSYFITVLPSPDVLTSTLKFSKTLSVDSSEIVLALPDGSNEMRLPILQPEDDLGNYHIPYGENDQLPPCSSEEGGSCEKIYVAIWLNTTTRNQVHLEGKNITFDSLFFPWSSPSSGISIANDINEAPNDSITR